MTTDARARACYSEGLGLLEQAIRKLRIGVEIERTLQDNSEPEVTGTCDPRLSRNNRPGGGINPSCADGAPEGGSSTSRRTRTTAFEGGPACANGN